MSLTRLSAPDAAFLSLESAAAPTHVGWAAVLAPPAVGPHPRFEDDLARIRFPRAAGACCAIAPAPLHTYFDRLGDPALLARRGARPIGRAGALDALPLRHSGAASLAGVRAWRPCRTPAGEVRR